MVAQLPTGPSEPPGRTHSSTAVRAVHPAIDIGPVVDREDGDVIVVEAVHDPEVAT